MSRRLPVRKLPSIWFDAGFKSDYVYNMSNALTFAESGNSPPVATRHGMTLHDSPPATPNTSESVLTSTLNHVCTRNVPARAACLCTKRCNDRREAQRSGRIRCSKGDPVRQQCWERSFKWQRQGRLTTSSSKN